jgi:hypothetical protein
VKEFDHRGKLQPTHYVEREHAKRFFDAIGVHLEAGSPLRCWLSGIAASEPERKSSARKLRPCQAAKQLIELYCELAWKIDPTWKIDGPGGIIDWVDYRHLNETWKRATLLGWARAVQGPVKRRPGRPKKICDF